MALLLIFIAVTEQRHPASLCELLHQTEGELLAVVLNRSAALIDWAIQEKLPSILP